MFGSEPSMLRKKYNKLALSAQEVAIEFGVDIGDIEKAVANGEIKALSLGDKKSFPIYYLDELANSLESPMFKKWNNGFYNNNPSTEEQKSDN